MIVYGKCQRTLSDEVKSMQRASDVPAVVAESMSPGAHEGVCCNQKVHNEIGFYFQKVDNEIWYYFTFQTTRLVWLYTNNRTRSRSESTNNTAKSEDTNNTKSTSATFQRSASEVLKCDKRLISAENLVLVQSQLNDPWEARMRAREEQISQSTGSVQMTKLPSLARFLTVLEGWNLECDRYYSHR